MCSEVGMNIYQLISILVLLSSWKCEGGKPHIPREIFSSSDEKPEDRAKLTLLDSLLLSKSMGDKNLQGVMKTKKLKLQSNLAKSEESVKKMTSQTSAKNFPSRIKDKSPSKSAKSSLIQEIMKMSEANAAALAQSIMNPKTGTIIKTAIQGEGSSKGKARVMNNEISDVSKLVSHGYNLLRGCPEGDFTTGGTDPGIMTSRQIFKFSFNQGKADDRSLPQPDQVDFEPHSDFTSVSSDNVYGGGKSYRDAVTTAISAAGTYKAFQFSASEIMAAIHQEATSTRSIFLDHKQTLTFGEVRYLHNDDSLNNDITDEFYNAVMRLPIRFFGLSAEDRQIYHDFFDEWGTDLIVRAEIGLKYITRYRANYASAFSFIKSSTTDHIDAGEVSSGVVNINIDTLSDTITASSQFGNHETELEIGTEDSPVPTKLYLEPINRALDGKFWFAKFGNPQGNATATQLYNSLTIRQTLLEWQIQDYATSVGSILEDPDMSVPIEWPQGTYALPQTTSGCPTNFSSGCRTQDNEDTNNENQFSFNIDWDMLGQFDNRNNDVQTCFCSKTDPGDSIFSWMPGCYCINRKGGSCPEGFTTTGYIKWDDENDHNINENNGVLPDGQYSNTSTLMYYCCRDDGNTEDDILLPNTRPFVLYPYKENMCQEVHGMESMKHFVYTDDEDENNQDQCVDEVPYITNDCTGSDIKITYCYYQPH